MQYGVFQDEQIGISFSLSQEAEFAQPQKADICRDDMREMGMLTVKVLMETRQKGHLQWVVHSVAYFFWLVKNLKYTRPQGSSPFLALAATSLSYNTA